jgi:ribose 1,5-bisphosphokinase
MSDARLLYVVGPSGAGKDSLIQRLKAVSLENGSIYFVSRFVDRSSHESTPQDIYMSCADFQKALDNKELAMHWRANQHQYGISHAEMAQSKLHPISVINGSRGYVAQLIKEYPSVEVIHITASEAVIKDRLIARKREDSLQIDQRLERSKGLEGMSQLFNKEIRNDSSLEAAFYQLLGYIKHKV